ncbi:hypothetical protein ACVWY2_006089 [Bradyrhizobium sp. JR6.1]
MPMQKAGGASSATDTRMRMSVGAERAQAVTAGVSRPAATSVAPSATRRAINMAGREGAAPTVALPMPPNSRIVNSTTLSP